MYQQRRRIGGAKPKRYGTNARSSSRGTRVPTSNYPRASKRTAPTLSTGIPVELKSSDQEIYATAKWSVNAATNVPYVGGGGGGAPGANNFSASQSCHIHSIKRGTSSYNRIGRQIRLVSLHGRYSIKLIGNTSGQPETARVMFVLDRYPRAGTVGTYNVVPLTQDILDMTSGEDNAVNTRATFCFQNLSNTNRFRILHDKSIVLNRPSHMKYQHGPDGALVLSETGSNEGHFVEFNVKINESAKYKEDAEAGDYDKSDQGALLMLLLINDTLVEFHINGMTRLRYTDA